MRSFLLVAVLSLACGTTQAQSEPQQRLPMEIYVQASGMGQGVLDSGGPSPGFRAGAAWTPLRHFGLTGDFGYYNGSHASLATFMAGPRYSTDETYRTTWFAQALFGGARSSIPSQTGAAAALGGGVDIRLTDRIVFRAFEFEFFARGILSARISSGFAVRLGHAK